MPERSSFSLPLLLYILAIDKITFYVIKYDYDAWGRVINTEYSDTLYTVWENAYFNAYSIGQLNSLIYKDYYYDKDLELYYLQTRYYDPSTCRFISPDHPNYLDYESINGLNLYAYCLNNPVMYYDPTGHSWESFWNGIKNGWNNFWNSVENWFVKTGNSIGNFFTRVIPDFFTNTIPDWWNGSIVSWWNINVVPFFTRVIPKFFNKTIPNFFVNTFWKDWIVDKFWNQFLVGIIWKQGLLPAWNWLNGKSWYQIVVKNIVIIAISTAIGAIVGSLLGPVGTIPGIIIGAIIGIVVGVLWDFGVSGINP